MTTALENIAKAKDILLRLEKIGVGSEGGGEAPHDTGPFGNEYNESCEKENTALPTSICNEGKFQRKRLDEVEKDQGGAPYINGGFGLTDEKNEDPEENYMPKKINSDDNCFTSDCLKDKKERLKHREGGNTGQLEMAQIGPTL